MQKDKITIYTDGAARGNPGPAGWAAVILLNGGQNVLPEIIELGGTSPHATNNIMELTAPIEAMKYLKNEMSKRHFDTGQEEIVSDSKYVILGITEWIKNWMKNNWRNAANKPVMNRELWEELYKLNEEFKPKWTYVEGHNGDKYNERADQIATGLAGGEKIELKK